MKTKKNFLNKKSFTKKRRPALFKIQNSIIVKLVEMLNTVKLYHWFTMSRSEHDATDDLYEKMNKHIDKMVEIMIGKTGLVVHNMCVKCNKIKTKKQLVGKINEYKSFLKSLNKKLNKDHDMDLLAVRAELLGDFNNLLYLFRLK